MERLTHLTTAKENQFSEKPDSEIYMFDREQVPFVHKVITGLHEHGVTDIKITQYFYGDSPDDPVSMRIINPDLFAYTFKTLIAFQEHYPAWNLDFIIDGIVPVLAQEWQQPPTSPETGYSV